MQKKYLAESPWVERACQSSGREVEHLNTLDGEAKITGDTRQRHAYRAAPRAEGWEGFGTANVRHLCSAPLTLKAGVEQSHRWRGDQQSYLPWYSSQPRHQARASTCTRDWGCKVRECATYIYLPRRVAQKATAVLGGS